MKIHSNNALAVNHAQDLNGPWGQHDTSSRKVAAAGHGEGLLHSKIGGACSGSVRIALHSAFPCPRGIKFRQKAHLIRNFRQDQYLGLPVDIDRKEEDIILRHGLTIGTIRCGLAAVP